MAETASETSRVFPVDASSSNDASPRRSAGRRTTAAIRSRFTYRSRRSVAVARSATASERDAGGPLTNHLENAWRDTPNTRAAPALLRPHSSTNRSSGWTRTARSSSSTSLRVQSWSRAAITAAAASVGDMSVSATAICQPYVKRNHLSTTLDMRTGRVREPAPFSAVCPGLLVGEEPSEVFNSVVLARDERFDVVVGNAVVILHRR
jgi:hypothetical protein